MRGGHATFAQDDTADRMSESTGRTGADHSVEFTPAQAGVSHRLFAFSNLIHWDRSGRASQVSRILGRIPPNVALALDGYCGTSPDVSDLGCR